MLILTLVLGVVQIIFTLYARNVVHASTYEGVRVAIERGASDRAAIQAAAETVRKSAGGLVDDLRIAVHRQKAGQRAYVVLSAAGSIRPVGLIPVQIPVRATARSLLPEDPR